ncbi:MAG TPA: hypothetical protein DDZ60_14560 [Planktothrix sp. UBA10369]|nr:hypothetical protein [Planktothrix sp. UBA10369]
MLAEVQQHLKPGNRLHSFGAGSSVNRFLINRIAELGRGISRIIRHDEAVEPVLQQFFTQINNPVLTNIQVSWQGEGEKSVIYPTLTPDLFAEQPLVLFGKKPDGNSGVLQIQGSAAGGTSYQQRFNLNFESEGNPAVAQLWGRSRIKTLMNQMVQGETKAGVEAVTETALTYQLLSQYTAFVAVSDDVRVNPSEASVSVQVPVEMPEAVSSEGMYGGYGSVLQAPSAPSARSMFRRGMEMMRGFRMNESLVFSEPTEMDAFFEEGVFLEFEPPSPILTSLEIVSATGLDQEAIAFLTQHLQSIKIPTGIKGNLVFELKIHKKRVKQVMLDEEASTIQDAKIIELIRRSLLTWKPVQTNPITVVLTLKIDC